MSRYLFAATIFAQHITKKSTVSEFTTIILFAHSKSEAIGASLEYAQTIVYPLLKGYVNHQAIVMQPSAENLLLGLAAYGLAEN